jgi:hypothetical protein
MTTRSALLRGSAALALALGLLATTTISPAYAKPANPQGAVPSVPAGVPGLPGFGTANMSSTDVVQMVAGGLRIAADATEIVVPLVIEAVSDD